MAHYGVLYVLEQRWGPQMLRGNLLSLLSPLNGPAFKYQWIGMLSYIASWLKSIVNGAEIQSLSYMTTKKYAGLHRAAICALELNLTIGTI